MFFTCKDQRERHDRGYRIDWIGPKIYDNRNCKNSLINVQVICTLYHCYDCFSPVKIEGKYVTKDIVLIGLVPRLPPKEIASPLSSEMNFPSSKKNNFKNNF